MLLSAFSLIPKGGGASLEGKGLIVIHFTRGNGGKSENKEKKWGTEVIHVRSTVRGIMIKDFLMVHEHVEGGGDGGRPTGGGVSWLKVGCDQQGGRNGIDLA